MRWLLLLLPLAGCMMPCHKANDWALAPEPECDCPIENRNRVHVYILNGAEPFVSMAPMREKLNKAGFAKVNSGGLFFTASFESRIRKIHEEDPDSRFVLLGYGLGTRFAESLAAKLSADGINVDHVIDGAVDDADAGAVIAALQGSGQALPPKAETVVAAIPLIDSPAPMPRIPQSVSKKVPGVLTSQPKEKP